MDDILMPLTELQFKVLKTVVSFFKREHHPPTIAEIQEKIGIDNAGTVFTVLTSLEKKNYILRVKNENRNIRLTELTANLKNLNKIKVLKK